MASEFEYDVAISFAGEDRAHADNIANALTENGVRVFYDDYEKAELWGKDLYTHLSEIYQKRSRYCIVLVSKHYIDKRWTKQEIKAAQARAFNESKEYILPVRLDDSEVSGIFPTVAYLRYPPETGETISNAILEKLGRRLSAKSKGKTMKDPIDSGHNIRVFQHRLEKLYGNANKKLSIEYIYGYLCRTIGYLCKSVADKTVAEEDFIRPLSWLFAFASKIGIDVENSFLLRYPERCPHCLQKVCVCFKTGKKPPEYIPAYKVKEELEWNYNTVINTKKHINFDFAGKAISSTYPNNDVIMYHAGPWHHFSKLQEEVSEIHEALSAFTQGKRPLSSVSEEVADVFAWLVGLWQIKLPDKSLDQELINYFFEGCPVCHKTPCGCQPYSGRPDTLIDEQLLIQAKGHLQNLADLMPSHIHEIDELIKSLNVAIETHNEPIARLTVSQAIYGLRQIKSGISTDSNKQILLLLDIVLELLNQTHRTGT